MTLEEELGVWARFYRLNPCSDLTIADIIRAAVNETAEYCSRPDVSDLSEALRLAEEKIAMMEEKGM